MLRFVPDTWLDGLLRPLLLADPAAGLYLEAQAPDWRFLLLSLSFALLAITATLRRRPIGIGDAGGRTLIALGLAFYLWTFASGNGRYFLWGLLIAGPLLVMTIRRLPLTRAMRNTVLIGAVALQGWTVQMTFSPNLWTLRPWRVPGDVVIADNRFQHEPAVLLTVGSISHSILVPHFHPQSRWSNLAGQHDVERGSRDEARLLALFSSPLPKFAVIRANHLVMDRELQPIDEAWKAIRRVLARYELGPATTRCELVPTAIAGWEDRIDGDRAAPSGFWFCPVVRINGSHERATEAAIAPELDEVFALVEARCPRFFPSGNARTRASEDGAVRWYSHSDTTLSVNQAGAVYYKYMRALNPTVVGTAADVRAGRFEIDCERLPGRYSPPWARD